MLIKQYEIWIADLNPQIGTETGKTRPVLIVQTDLLNKTQHPSSIICPLTTKIHRDSQILRVYLKKGTGDLHEECDVMIDQIRVVDNRRLLKKIGVLPHDLIQTIKMNLAIILDLE